MNTESEIELSKAYDFLKSGNLKRAHEILKNALEQDLENKEILYTMRCIFFWSNELDNIGQLSSPYEQGESIVLRWKKFTQFIEDDGSSFERSVYAIRQGVFSLALQYYQAMFKDNVQQPGADLYRKVGLCLKRLGDYETALKCLESANSIISGSAEILSEMADCYAFCGEDKMAKLLFREAFFIDPLKVDLTLLDSELICNLVTQTSKMVKANGQLLQEWIPVYGVIFGVFTVKRELSGIEIGKLKQSIYALESDLREDGNEPTLLIPRLINHYFWLIDHYGNSSEDFPKIDETLLKIKILDINIHDKYKKTL